MTCYFQAVPVDFFDVVMANTIFSSEGWTIGLTSRIPFSTMFKTFNDLRWGSDLRPYNPPSEAIPRLQEIQPPPARTRPARPVAPAVEEKTVEDVEDVVTWVDEYRTREKPPRVWKIGVKVLIKFHPDIIQERMVVGVGSVSQAHEKEVKRRYMLLLWRYVIK
jgi:hypothetical protein